jgi:hypothetical protein
LLHIEVVDGMILIEITLQNCKKVALGAIPQMGDGLLVN